MRVSQARARSLSAVIPKRFRGVSFERAPVTEIEPTVVREVRRYVDGLDEHLDTGRGLWFMGDVGTGKTTLAMLVSQAALRAGRSVAIYSLPRLLDEIRKTRTTSAPSARATGSWSSSTRSSTPATRTSARS